MTEVLQVSRVEWAGPQDYYDSCPDSTSDSTSFMPGITLSMPVHVIGSVPRYFVLHSFVLVMHDHKCQNLSFSFVVQGAPA